MAAKARFVISARNATDAAFRSIERNLSTTTRIMGRLQAATLAFIGVRGVAGLSKSFIHASSTAENLGVRLKVLLGSAEEGNKVFADMTDLASKVPFEYEKIMSAATQLSGIVKGGSDEIKETMPLILDLAAASGLGIQQTTEQVIRMFSAGAASADLFRERGITAMLGFQAGVSVSAEETKRRVIAAWEDQNSKFRGATEELAKTFTGRMSIIQDKWFQFRKIVGDAGLFAIVKGALAEFDTAFGNFIETSKTDAVGWVGVMIQGVGFVGDAFRGLQVVWNILLATFHSLTGLITAGLDEIQKGVVRFINLLPLVDIKPFQDLSDENVRIQEEFSKTMARLNELVNAEAPSDRFERWASNVIAASKQAEESVKRVLPTATATEEALTKEEQQRRQGLEKQLTNLTESLLTEEEQLQLSFERKMEILRQSEELRLGENVNFAEQRRLLEEGHQSELTELHKKGEEERTKQTQQLSRSRMGVVGGLLRNLSTLMSSESKKQFEIGKKAAIAQTLIDTYQSAVEAYKALAGIPIVGPALGAAAAAAAIGFGLTQVSRIRSQSFGGGGGGGAGTAPAATGGGGAAGGTTGGTPINDFQDQQAGTRGTAQIIITGNVLSRQFVLEEVAPVLQDAVENFDLVLVSPGTTNQRELLEEV